jgi:hypothetical protein
MKLSDILHKLDAKSLIQLHKDNDGWHLDGKIRERLSIVQAWSVRPAQKTDIRPLSSVMANSASGTVRPSTRAILSPDEFGSGSWNTTR